MKIMQNLIRLLPLLIVALIILQFTASNELAGLGDTVGNLDRKIAALTHENELLHQRVASASSLLTISVKANEMGLVAPSKFLTIGPEQFPVALGSSR